MHSNSLDPGGADYKRLVTSLRDMGLVTSTTPRILPLTGGVSSLIALVEEDGTKFCAKSALAKLKVASDWRAPVHRNQSEVAWMRTAGQIVPDAVPAILGEDPAQNVFAMEWLDPDQYPVWKQQLMEGEVSVELARKMGAVLGTIHAQTARNPDIAAQFANDADFDALRLDPYLRATANSHPNVAGQLLAILEETAATRFALIHGDVSPKNILSGPKGPIVLDAECATYGDPAFDLAFCLNHLILKAVHLPEHKTALTQSYDAMVHSYLSHVNWEPVPAIQARTAALLPALALARVDGKSPVEYLSDVARITVRETALGLIKSPVSTLDIFLKNWMETPK